MARRRRREEKEKKEEKVVTLPEEEDVQVLAEEKTGMGLDMGLLFATTFFLVAAVVMIMFVLKGYNAGPLA